MYQRKVSTLVALVGSTGLALAVGCGKGTQHDTSARRSLEGAPERQVASAAAAEQVEPVSDVPMPGWLRGEDGLGGGAMLTPPLARGHRADDALGEPPMPQATLPQTLAAGALEERSGFKSSGHARLAETVTPDQTVAAVPQEHIILHGELTPRTEEASQKFAATAAPSTGDLSVEAAAGGAVDDATLVADLDGTHSLKVLSTSPLAPIPADAVAKSTTNAITPTPLAMTVERPSEQVVNPFVKPTVKADETVDENSVPTSPAADSPATDSIAAATADVPRLRADLQPLTHPLAVTMSPSESATPSADELVGEATSDASPAQQSNQQPSLISIRGLADATPAVEAPAAEPLAAKSNVAADSRSAAPPRTTVPRVEARLAAKQPAVTHPAAAKPTVSKPVEVSLAEAAPPPSAPLAATFKTNTNDAAELEATQRASVPSVAATPIVSQPVAAIPPVDTPATSVAVDPPAVDVAANESVQPRVALSEQADGGKPANHPAEQTFAPTPHLEVAESLKKSIEAPVAPQPATAATIDQLVASAQAHNNAEARRQFRAPANRGQAAAPQSRVNPLLAQAPRQAAPPSMSREMLAVRKMADMHTFNGFDLAARRALFSAEAEFVSALRVLTRAADRQTGKKERAEALAEGILALEESTDFLASGSELEADYDVSMIVSGHRTEVLRGAENLSAMTPLEASQHYYAFAQQRLADAVAGEPSGSFALYGLGKLYAARCLEPGANPEALEPKAMVFHQSALMSCPLNYMAANELAVLLARYGKLEKARDLLVHSVRIAPQASTWHNLATVHAELGERQLADAATAERTYAEHRAPSSVSDAEVSPVRWLEPGDFARSSDQTRSPMATTNTEPTIKPTVESKPTAKTPVQQTAAKDDGLFGLFKRK